MILRPDFPSTYLITPEPRPGVPLADFIDTLAASLDAGVRLVQLRAKTLDPAQYMELAVLALTCCRRRGARLVLNGPAALLAELDADGVHLDSTRLMACARRPLADSKLLSVACHDLEQIEQANRIDADLVTVSPVLPTQTHPAAMPIGWARFAQLAALSCAPVYALGGMQTQHLPQARDAGAQGIAAIRALWAAAAA